MINDMDSYISMNINNMNTIIDEFYTTYRITNSDLIEHNILLEAAIVMNDIAINIRNTSQNIQRPIIPPINDLENLINDDDYYAHIVSHETYQREMTAYNIVITTADDIYHAHLVTSPLYHLRTLSIGLHRIRNIAMKNLIDQTEKYAFLIAEKICDKDSISGNIYDIISISTILLPIVNEKYIVSKIMSMKQDMELIKLKQEYKYLGLKRSEYGL